MKKYVHNIPEQFASVEDYLGYAEGKTAEELGYKVGDVFEITKNAWVCDNSDWDVDYKDIVTLYEDDRTRHPYFIGGREPCEVSFSFGVIIPVKEVTSPQEQPTSNGEGWITWDGGEMPVDKGTMVEVIHRNGNQTTVTAGLYKYDEGFKRLSGSDWVAASWYHTASQGDIIAYRIVEAPSEAVEEESTQVDTKVAEEVKQAVSSLQVSLNVVVDNEAVIEDFTQWVSDNADVIVKMYVDATNLEKFLTTKLEVVK